MLWVMPLCVNVIEILRHGLPLNGHEVGEPLLLNQVQIGCLFAKSRHAITALTGDKGGYTLSGKGELHFIMSFDGQIPVHVRMRVNDTRHDNQSRAVDDRER